MHIGFPFFVARRYLFAHRSRNVINVISAITLAGIALASMAMICTLSVFNGFHGLIENLFTDFDPDVKITAAKGKVFDPADSVLSSVRNLPFIEAMTYSLEDQALIQYNSAQAIITVKGVEDNVCEVYGLDAILKGNGELVFKDNVCDYGIPGIGLASILDCGVQPAFPFSVYAPERGGRVNMSNPADNFNKVSVYSPGVVFQVNQQPYDDSYLLVSLELARRLFGYSGEVSSMDIRLKNGVSQKKACRELRQCLGDAYTVMNRYEQQSDVFKVVRLEKMISYLFLTFILLIACFNIIGSLIMLMVDKEEDTSILKSMGLTPELTSRIFVYDGLLIAVCGALAGLLLGVVLALLQQCFGFIPLGANGGFIVDSYPVRVKFADILLVLVTVTVVTLLSVWPVRKIADKFIKSERNQDY